MSQPVRSEQRPSVWVQLSEAARWIFAYDAEKNWSQVRVGVIVGGVLATAALLWAFWPTIVEVVASWETVPDYSHGYLIAPIALFFLWARRDKFPGWSQGPIWAGLALILFGIGLRVIGARMFLGSVDAWAFIVCLAGAAWVVLGTRVFWWSLPSIVYLFFAVPLPYRAERGLSLSLQTIATKFSTWTLQLLGQPAIAEGRTILLGEHHLEVEHACSGMRIFLSIFAVAFAYLVLVRRSWWEKGLICLAIIPIALIANMTRIVITGLLYQWVSGEAAQKFSHDWAGYAMIPFAALLFALMLWYLRRVYREVDVFDNRDLILAQRD